MTDPFHPIKGNASAPKKNGAWIPIIPVPADAPPPPSRHPSLGSPTETYTYFAENAEINGYVLRFDHAGGKEFRPLTYCLHPGGIFRDWRWTAWRRPRPLFILDKLHR